MEIKTLIDVKKLINRKGMVLLKVRSNSRNRSMRMPGNENFYVWPCKANQMLEMWASDDGNKALVATWAGAYIGMELDFIKVIGHAKYIAPQHIKIKDPTRSIIFKLNI